VKRSFFPALAGVLCLLLASCVTVSVNPLSSPDTAQVDPRLVGNWQAKKNHDLFQFTITKGAWMHVKITSENVGDKPDAYDLFPTVIGKNTFLNVVDNGKDDQGNPTKGYYFLRYKVSGDHVLHMWMISPDTAAAAVRSGKLQGLIKEDNSPIMGVKPTHPDINVTFQDTTANLVAFIQKSDLDDLFSEKMETLYRVK